MTIFLNYSFLIITAFCWGVTNVLIKQGSSGINTVKADNRLTQVFLEIKFLFLNWKVNKAKIKFVYKTNQFFMMQFHPQYLVPFLVNQSGSALYVYALQRNNLSIAVLVTNSLTLLITSVTSIIIEKRSVSYRTYIGALLICLGSSICAINSQQ